MNTEPDNPRAFLIPVGAGEFVDRMTILEIKLAEIDDDQKKSLVRKQISALTSALEAAKDWFQVPLDEVSARLRTINKRLWKLESAIRVMEASGNFRPDFIACAREIRKLNDDRAREKRRIDELLMSSQVEVKSFLP